MASLDKAGLINQLVPPLDDQLANQLLDDYISLNKRYVLGEWEPATLDGGQFAEVASRIVYHQDSKNLNRRKSLDHCLSYVEDPKNNNTHHFPERKSALHLCKVIRTIYKFRSDRGAIHIDPEYTANHLDSKLVLENSSWVLSEILRVFWTGDRKVVSKTIRYILDYDIPVIAEYEGALYVQRTDCTAEEEILIILHHVGESGLSKKEIESYVHKDRSGVSKALKTLTSNKKRQLYILPNKNYRLTDVGIKRVLTELADKLVV